MNFATVKTLGWSLATIICVRNLIMDLSIVKDDGMRPTLRKGDVVLVDCTRRQKVRHGDVLLIRNPEGARGDTHKRLIRRVEKIGARYPGTWFLVKDDKTDELSRDSKNFGSVSEALVLGKAMFVIFPPWRAGSIVQS